MQAFCGKHAGKIAGVLSCFDRMLFRGYLPIMSGASMAQFLQSEQVNCGSLKQFLLTTSERLKGHAQRMVGAGGRPFIYVASADVFSFKYMKNDPYVSSGPALLIPGGGGGQFNSIGAMVIPGVGTLYFGPYNSSGDWGTLAAENGVLVASDGGSRRVSAPQRRDEATFDGDGWTFKAAPGWVVREAARRGWCACFRRLSRAGCFRSST